MKRHTEAHSESEIDSIGDKFVAAWEAGDQPQIEEYLQQARAAATGELLMRLIELDLLHRRADSPQPRSDSYKARFPGFVQSVDDAFDRFHRTLAAAPETTSSFPSPYSQTDVGKTLSADDTSTLVPRPDSWGSPLAIEKSQKIGRYTVIQELGRGGQGAVYRAIHPNLPIELAIKISIKPLDADYQQALREEAQILCELDHPNIARVRDLDFYQGRPFLVLDFIRGRSLRERLGTEEVPIEQAVEWLAVVARAIDFAHRRGTVHLDLKPDNIVIDENNEPKVIDFGLARMRGAWRDAFTEEDRVSGTLQYMSPEQAEGKAKRIGSHSDVFALGAILYHILVGRPPFEGRDVRRVLEAIRRCEFEREPLNESDTRPELRDACLKAMSTEPADRFASATDFADAISMPTSAAKKPDLWSPRALGISLIVTAAALAMIVLFSIDLINGSPDSKAGASARASKDPGSDSKADSAGGTIERLAITHIGNHRDGSEFSVPLFQQRAPREQDDIQISAAFARPVYCFLFALNPDGAVQLCYPDSETQVQSEPIGQLVYPSDKKLAFGLTDGAGHQAFVLVTSEHPLPAFQQWRSSLSVVAWPDETIMGNWVYSDGDLTPHQFADDNLGAPQSRGDIRPTQEPKALESCFEAIRKTGDVEVEGVVFEVRDL